MRFGLARRLLGAVTGEDILPPELARRLAKKPNAVYRWETGEDRPRQDTVAELAEMCQRAGLPITAGWLERGETVLGSISIPAAALIPKQEVRQDHRAKGRRVVRTKLRAKQG
jgi:transcriptional regulator with XRE-family HTH domain